MALLQVPNKENELILNTPNRNEILKDGPPENAKSNILGRGAYGIVFKAIFRAKQVAVKIVKNLKDANLQSMHNEANILGWKHRNIVKILKIESTPNFGIVIMERFSGHCLQMILDTVELPLIHRIFITLDILAALTYCHKRQVLHLDIKPQNILLSFGEFPLYAQKQQRIVTTNSRNYICKLCDFGASMKMIEQQENANKGTAKGTVRYMSPEALREEPLNTAADIFSLGVTMWQLQHRRLPYYWIECNEVVAYQVVKNNLRPDVKITTNSEKIYYRANLQVHRSCFCVNFSSESSYHTLSYIKNLLNCRRPQHSQHDAEQHLSECMIARKVITLSTVANRRPFQDMNCKANIHSFAGNANVIRNLHTELGFITPLKDCLSGANTVSTENINLSAIFKQPACMQSIFKVCTYETLYKNCWHSNPHARLSSLELRKRLMKLL